MPTLPTNHFGSIDYRESDVLEFPEGLPGFESERRFLPIEQPANKPVVFLQSLRSPGLCWLTLPPRIIDGDYEFTISAEDRTMLDLPGEQQSGEAGDLACLVIVSLSPDSPPTANLLAPVVINLRNGKAVQSIQSGSRYSHQTPLPSSVEEPACS